MGSCIYFSQWMGRHREREMLLHIHICCYRYIYSGTQAGPRDVPCCPKSKTGGLNCTMVIKPECKFQLFLNLHISQKDMIFPLSEKHSHPFVVGWAMHLQRGPYELLKLWILSVYIFSQLLFEFSFEIKHIGSKKKRIEFILSSLSVFFLLAGQLWQAKGKNFWNQPSKTEKRAE